MGCPDDNTLMAMLENDLPAARFAELEVHIDSCEHCRKLIAAAATSRSLAVGTPAGGDELDKLDSLVDLSVGGRYVIEAMLGRGGMGTVYLARDQSLGRDVALKLHRAGSGKDRLHREAVAMAKLAHPNVVTVFEVGELDDRLYVAMEYVRGTTLRGWLEAQRRTWKEIVAMLLDAGAGLAAAHAAGLIHRDFKPENVLVGDDGRPRVGDFGLARAGAGRDSAERIGALATLDTPMTVTGAVLGTPAYMAPEQLAGEIVDARCDQFAFAVASWEALYGKRPFAGATIEALQDAIDHGELVEPPRRDVPERVRKVLARALAVDPDKRYADLPSFLAALRGAARTPRRRVAAIAIGAAVAIAATVGGVSYAGARHHQAACASKGDAAAAVFGPLVRARVALAFAATATPYAAGAYDHVASVLGRRVDSLATRTVAACHAADGLAAAREACLAQHASEVSSFVDNLAHVNAVAVQRAPAAAWALHDSAECEDPRYLMEHPADPAGSDPALAAQLAHIHAELAGGHIKAGIGDAEALVKQAHARGDRPFELQGLAALGALRGNADDPAGALAADQQALALAEALGRDVAAATILIQAAHVAGFIQHDHATAHRDLELARAKLERIGGANLAITGDIDENEAQLLLDENRLGAAEPVLRKAIGELERAYGTDHPKLGVAYATLSQVLVMEGRVADALAPAQHALAVFEGAFGELHPDVGGARITVAQVLVQLKRYDEARDELAHADRIVVATFGKDHSVRAEIYGTLGEIDEAQHQWDAALEADRSAQRILEHAAGPVSPEVAETHSDLARVLSLSGKPDDAMAELDQALAILDKLGPDAEPQLLSVLAAAATTQLDRKHPELAVAPAERAVTLAGKLRDAADPTDVATVQFALARALWDTGKDRVRARQLAAQAKAGKPTPERLASIDAWLAAHP